MTINHRYIRNNLFVPDGAVALVVGTFPSVLIKEAKKSLSIDDVDFYYGSHNNFFWKDLENIANRKLTYLRTAGAIEERKQLLASLKTGITDIILQCETTGGAADQDLGRLVYNDGIVDMLDENPTVTTLFFTSGSGRVNAATLTLRLLKSKGRISKVRVTQKTSPKIRTFVFTSASGETRELRSVTLYSPSPTARRGGVTEEKRRSQYSEYLKGLLR